MKKRINLKNIFCLIISFGCIVNLSAQKSKKEFNAEPVTDFHLDRYLGTWYEIGRFDFKWEKNLENVTAEYSLNENGTIKVKNSGFDFIKKKQKEAIGKAKFRGNQKKLGALKVSFFGPFYSAYTIVTIDKDYNHALVAGANNKLLWILSRTKTISQETKEKYVKIAESMDYDMTDFIWTVQN